MAFIACKLPHGLTICHNATRIILLGANVGEDLENVSRNGSPSDNARRVSGFGVTELDAGKTETFVDWAASVTYVDGDRAKGKLTEPFQALDNGAILGPFKTFDEARKECAGLSAQIVTGVEGLNPEKEKVETDKDAGKKS